MFRRDKLSDLVVTVGFIAFILGLLHICRPPEEKGYEYVPKQSQQRIVHHGGDHD